MIKNIIITLLVTITSYQQVTTYDVEKHRARNIWHRVTDVQIDTHGILHFKSYGIDVILKSDNFIVEPDEAEE